MEAKIRVVVFWATPYKLIDGYQRFGGIYSHYLGAEDRGRTFL